MFMMIQTTTSLNSQYGVQIKQVRDAVQERQTHTEKNALKRVICRDGRSEKQELNKKHNITYTKVRLNYFSSFFYYKYKNIEKASFSFYEEHKNIEIKIEFSLI